MGLKGFTGPKGFHQLATALVAAVVVTSCVRVEADRATADPHPAPASAPIPTSAPAVRENRLSGTVEAIHSVRILVPALRGQNNRMTLTSLADNGSRVEAGGVIAQFDPLAQIEDARSAQGRQDDLEQQVQQRAAQNQADEERRRSDIQQAQADLQKAQLEVSKAEILPQINREQNAIRARMAKERLASLKISNDYHDQSEAAALRILELQRDRQKVALERAQANIEKLQMRAPIAGMVAHTMQYRSGSITHVQVGDQLNRGTSLMSIFDPNEMLVRCQVGEPDRMDLRPGLRATVYLDAYPDVALPAHFDSSSPIVTSGMGTPIKTFTAVFRLDRSDPRLMPDLSASVVLETNSAREKTRPHPESNREVHP